MCCSGQQFPRGLLSQHIFHAICCCDLVSWVGLTKSKLFSFSIRRNCLFEMLTCFKSKGVLISGTCSSTYFSSALRSIGCRTFPAILITSFDWQQQSDTWRRIVKLSVRLLCSHLQVYITTSPRISRAMTELRKIVASAFIVYWRLLTAFCQIRTYVNRTSQAE